MKIKSFLAKPFANYIYRQIKKGMTTAVTDQQQIFQQLVKSAAKTEFGKEHGFDEIPPELAAKARAAIKEVQAAP